jgi:hypothetical protein
MQEIEEKPDQNQIVSWLVRVSPPAILDEADIRTELTALLSERGHIDAISPARKRRI